MTFSYEGNNTSFRWLMCEYDYILTVMLKVVLSPNAIFSTKIDVNIFVCTD